MVHLKRTQATFVASQFSLSDADYQLSPEFERALQALVKVLNMDERLIQKACERIFCEFGSHFVRGAILGGKYVLEASVTARSNSTAQNVSEALGLALSSRMSMAGSALGFGGGFGGAGTGANAVGAETHTHVHDDAAETDKDIHKRMCMSTYVTGGVTGELADWLNAMQEGNEVWEVIQRNHFMYVSKSQTRSSNIEHDLWHIHDMHILIIMLTLTLTCAHAPDIYVAHMHMYMCMSRAHVHVNMSHAHVHVNMDVLQYGA